MRTEQVRKLRSGDELGHGSTPPYRGNVGSEAILEIVPEWQHLCKGEWVHFPGATID
jgi:hypothetical protein